MKSDLLFSSAFQNLTVPVIVCLDDDGLTVVHENISACTLFNPFLPLKDNRLTDPTHPLRQVLRFEHSEDYDELRDLLRSREVLQNHLAAVLTHEGNALPVSISASRVVAEGVTYVLLYVYVTQAGQADVHSLAGVLSNAFQMTFSADSTDEAIDSILAYAGNQTQASRAYIFEAVSATMTSNTYEWCAAGVEPAIQELQNLPKDEYSYDEILARGLFVTDDVRQLSPEDRAVLEPQGIKALAILPISHKGKPLGYLGFDDCDDYRKWSAVEIQVLRDLSDVLASLLARRDMERSLSHSLGVLQTITDNTDNVVYVNDIATYELVFINKPLSEALGVKAEDIVGHACWQALQKDMTGPCPFCPIEQTKVNGDIYTWEFQNTRNGKWYLVRDAIIKWIDGRDVHIETATEITHQKQYEEQLKQIASTDMLTGLYNREWGYTIMQQMLDSVNPGENSLVFIDLDGLKQVNDTFGHEAGDQMLIETANVLRGSVRKSDAICRWGGDEFILLLRCNPGQAEKVMATVQRNLDKANATEHLPFQLRLSYGIMPLDSRNEMGIDAVISAADKLMYENKMSKRI